MMFLEHVRARHEARAPKDEVPVDEFFDEPTVLHRLERDRERERAAVSEKHSLSLGGGGCDRNGAHRYAAEKEELRLIELL